MSLCCEVVLRWDMTPEQQRVLGVALWGWCQSRSEYAGIYQYLDNQGLADLLAGRFPTVDSFNRNAGQPSVSFQVSGDPAHDRQAVLESLRRALPGAGIAAIRVDGLPATNSSVGEPTFTGAT